MASVSANLQFAITSFPKRGQIQPPPMRHFPSKTSNYSETSSAVRSLSSTLSSTAAANNTNTSGADEGFGCGCDGNVGIITGGGGGNNCKASHLALRGLHALQHRGRGAAGIASSDDGRIHSISGPGYISKVFEGNDQYSALDLLPGSTAIARAASSTTTAIPVVSNLAVALSGKLLSSQHNILPLIESGEGPLVARVVKTFESLQGRAYSLVLLSSDENKLIAVRDPHGFRPLVMGRIRRREGEGESIVFASETVALRAMGAEFVREVNPGEVIIAGENDDNNNYSPTVATLFLINPGIRKIRACVSELLYLANPNSLVYGKVPAYLARNTFGEMLAEEYPVVGGADVVIPGSDLSLDAAIGFARISGIPCKQGLIRSHHVTRSVCQDSGNVRDVTSKLTMEPNPKVVRDKVVVLVDDSLARWNLARAVKKAGAREVHVRIASPPLAGHCPFGVDVNPRFKKYLVFNGMIDFVEATRREIGCDSIAFLSLETLKGLLEEKVTTVCDACFSLD